MTYGVDECRRCGKPIKPRGPEVMQRYLESRKDKKITMTEKEWRAAGWKAMPTKRQMTIMHDGCCYDCGFEVAVKSSSAARYMLPTLGILLLLFLTYFLIGSIFT